MNQILCSPRAREFAEHRMFPDEIVCCGVASVFMPLTDPGVKLAQAIRRETEAFIKKHQRQPRVILMQNHGIITLGGTWQSVLAAMLMAEKAAKVFVGAAALGGPVFMSEAERPAHCRPPGRSLPAARVENVTSLSGKSAIVTGASRGIGRAIAVALAREGVRLGLLCRTQPRPPVAGEFVACDFADLDRVPAAVEEFG